MSDELSGLEKQAVFYQRAGIPDFPVIYTVLVSSCRVLQYVASSKCNALISGKAKFKIYIPIWLSHSPLHGTKGSLVL